MRHDTVDESSKLFERALFAEAIEVDEALAAQFREIERVSRPTEPESGGTELGQAVEEKVGLLRLLPRDPHDLWLAYTSEADLLSPRQSEQTKELLRYLGIPYGLPDEGALVSAAGASLWLDPIVADFHKWLEADRRFGEVIDFVQHRSECSREEATYDAQTLVRSLLVGVP